MLRPDVEANPRMEVAWAMLTGGFPCARPFTPATQWVLTVQVLCGLRCADREPGLLEDLTQTGALPGLPAPGLAPSLQAGSQEHASCAPRGQQLWGSVGVR